MFVDEVNIFVRSGKGGDGCLCFRKDRHARFRKPNGGDGGDGGDIILKANSKIEDLSGLRQKRRFTAEDGADGGSNGKRGGDGRDKEVLVPIGTIVKDVRSNCLLKDLAYDSQELIVAKGGSRGYGNLSKDRQVEGRPGEEKELSLDLRINTDITIVGFPNTGKSSLLSSISKAKPQITDYPFCTKFPVLGIINTDDASFRITELPALIKASHKGKGLGNKFLKHIHRAKLIIHILDMSSNSGRDPVEDFFALNEELNFYSKEIKRKQQIVVANKMDNPCAKDNLGKFMLKVKDKILPISAKYKEGLEVLIEEIIRRI